MKGLIFLVCVILLVLAFPLDAQSGVIRGGCGPRGCSLDAAPQATAVAVAGVHFPRPLANRAKATATVSASGEQATATATAGTVKGPLRRWFQKRKGKV